MPSRYSLADADFLLILPRPATVGCSAGQLRAGALGGDSCQVALPFQV